MVVGVAVGEGQQDVAAGWVDHHGATRSLIKDVTGPADRGYQGLADEDRGRPCAVGVDDAVDQSQVHVACLSSVCIVGGGLGACLQRRRRPLREAVLDQPGFLQGAVAGHDHQPVDRDRGVPVPLLVGEQQPPVVGHRLLKPVRQREALVGHLHRAQRQRADQSLQFLVLRQPALYQPESRMVPEVVIDVAARGVVLKRGLPRPQLGEPASLTLSTISSLTSVNRLARSS